MAHQLTDSQKIALIMEADEAVALATVGLRTLEQLHHIVEEAAAVMTMLSIASEKLLKLALGLSAVDAGEPWPNVNKMRRYGHRIAKLDRRVRTLYRDDLEKATHPAYIGQLLDEVDADPFLPGILGVLDRWGDKGRFHRLDELAGAPQPGDPAHEQWQALETAIVEDHPTLADGLGTVAGYEAARARVNERLAESYCRWWALHTRAWMQGVVGAEGKRVAVTLSRLAS